MPHLLKKSIFAVASSVIFMTFCAAMDLHAENKQGSLSTPLERLAQFGSKENDLKLLSLWIKQANNSRARIQTERLLNDIHVLIGRINLHFLDDNEKQEFQKNLSQMNPQIRDWYTKSETRWKKEEQKKLKHGEEQLTLMLHDRPALTEYVSSGGPTWNWTVRQFAGKSTGIQVYWDREARYIGRARNYLKDDDSCAFISIPKLTRTVEPLRGDYLWSNVVFELFNVQNSGQFRQTELDAVAGKLSKDEFVRKIASLEFEASKQTFLFYQNLFLAQATSKGLHTNSDDWYDKIPDSFEAYFSRIPRGLGYHQLYEDRYDELLKAARTSK